ncbi:Stress-induced-phosphoprotein 1 [Seminavis robusta]|uniref:Hsp70-Hsp90 organising protein n=1 Tax=Seminavis robusta TaxID=568900 RepID=A0A9N8EM15_9STRA|nr:Stress-induced-phosphoprotein 1 [Seminavis robusta]|eukprot:Sro1153_g247040.1 Stress-induced-phosphoprotein 1 (571) ;mRNA; r:20760-22561
MATADEFKAKGNAALQAGNTSEAIEHYTAAIRLDGSNHVYFSNRSAAYLKKGDAHNALEDAVSCIGLNPSFSKGFSRKGAALHALKRYNDSIAAYEEGLAKFPGDAALTKGLEDAKREKDSPPMPGGGAGGMGGLAGLFSPEMVAQMALNPKTRPMLNDPDLMAKIKLVQSNPAMLPAMLQDPKIMALLGAMMGQEGEEDASAPAPAPTPPPAPKKEEKKEPEPEPEEDLSLLSPEERKKKEDQRAAKKKKEEGNEFYKNKKFAEAIECYDAAIALDPTAMTYLSNKAAVYFQQKKWDECIKECMTAVEIGKQNRAPFEDRAKAYTRAAKAYQKKGDLDEAIKMCNEAQLESFDKATQRLLKTMELENRKAKALAYQDEEKAEEAKQKGNDFFRAKQWGDAVTQYEEAVKRAPKNAPIRNNLSAALCKVMDFNGAKRQVEVALELDPKYVKAWARKGDIEMVMKEFHKAMESYKTGLVIDPENASCKEGLRKVNQQVAYGRANMTEDEKKEQAAHAMADPEIQAILQDPVMQQTLRDFSENPSSAQSAMNDPGMRAKINKLIAAGIIETG